MKQSRGSAILIAIFLVAAVGSVAFSIGRLFTLGTRLATQYEDSTIAFYAAESGIEEGYLRYRYNKNTEIAQDFDGISNMTLNRTNLNTLRTINGNFSIDPDSAGVPYYDLSMRYLVPFYGKDMGSPENSANGLDAADLARETTATDTAYPSEYFVPRDEAVKIDLSKLIDTSSALTKDFDLLVRFENDANNGPCARTNPFVELKVTGKTPLSPPASLTEQKIALTIDGANYSGIISNGERDLIKSPKDLSTQVITYNKLLASLRNVTSSGMLQPNNASNKVELMIKPVGCSARIGIKYPVSLSATNPEKYFAAPYSTIHSVGRYGGITRTLEAKIDRQAGTLYDLFDFVLYQR